MEIKEIEIVTDETDICKEIFVFKGDCHNMCKGTCKEKSINGPFVATIICPKCNIDVIDEKGEKLTLEYCCICSKPCKEGGCKFVDNVLYYYGYIMSFHAVIKVVKTVS